MNDIVTVLKETISDRNVRYVFPSEIAAGYWRKEALRVTGKKAVRSDRFLSWDRFKESGFSVRKIEKPANKLVRTFFAAELLAENANSQPPLFTSVIHPEHAANSSAFLSYIVSILPSLGGVRSFEQASLPRSLFDDLSLLFNRYQGFLKKHRLFEPAFEPLSLPRTEGKVFIIFPQVLEDFEEYRGALESARNITLVYGANGSGARDPMRNGYSSRDPETNGSGARDPETNGSLPVPLLRVFDNSIHELRRLMNGLLELLDSGTSPSELAITAADESTARAIEREAEKYSIPVTMVRGKTLCDYTAGGLFDAMDRCIEEEWGLDSLKQLLLNRGYPWSEPEQGRELVRFGIDYFCVRGKKVWMHHLTRTGNTRLLGFFKEITGRMTGIIRAGSFPELKARLNGFIDRFFTNDDWDETQLKVFQSCFKLIDDLTDSAVTIGASGEGQERGNAYLRPFQLFLSALKERIYVPPRNEEGIPVYPYRVAAGITPQHHFIVGASHEAVSVTVNRYPFLREDQKQLCDVSDLDFTDAFLDLYAVSGKNLSISCSRETSEGRRLVPGYFLARSAVTEEDTRAVVTDKNARSAVTEDAGDSVPHGKTPRSVKDRFVWEQLLWSDPSEVAVDASDLGGPLLHPVQKQGFLSITASGTAQKSVDFTQRPIADPSLRKALKTRLRGEEGLLHLGHSDIAAYQSCGFAFLLSGLLGIEEDHYETRYSDPLLIGTFLHAVLDAFFSALQERNEWFDPLRLDEYENLMAECVDKTAARREKRGAPFFPPVWESFLEKSRRLCGGFLHAEAEVFSGFSTAGLEYTASLRLPEKGVLLKGRIDRLASKNSADCSRSLSVIDYKKSVPFRKKDYLGTEILPASYQLPFYTYLLEAAGAEVASCSFYDITKGRYYHLYGDDGNKLFSSVGGRKPWLEREGMEKLISLMLTQLERLRNGIDSGDYSTPEEECSSCPLRTICRERYILD